VLVFSCRFIATPQTYNTFPLITRFIKI
jgi:hypothetical protein